MLIFTMGHMKKDDLLNDERVTGVMDEGENAYTKINVAKMLTKGRLNKNFEQSEYN